MIDRRELLVLSAAAAASSLVARAHASLRVAPRGLKKAVMWYMIEGGGTVLEKLERAKAAGFEGVELDSPTSEFTPDEAVDALGEDSPGVAAWAGAAGLRLTGVAIVVAALFLTGRFHPLALVVGLAVLPCALVTRGLRLGREGA